MRLCCYDPALDYKFTGLLKSRCNCNPCFGVIYQQRIGYFNRFFP